MGLQIFWYRYRVHLGALLAVALIATALALLARQRQGASGMIRLGDPQAGGHQPAAHPGTTAAPDPAPEPALVVRAASLGHATLDPARIVDAFNCARALHRLPTYTVDESLVEDARHIATRVLAGGRGPQSGEQGWTLTGSLVLDTTRPGDGCVVGGVDLSDVPDLERSSRIGVAVVPLSEPTLVLALVIGR